MIKESHKNLHCKSTTLYKHECTKDYNSYHKYNGTKKLRDVYSTPRIALLKKCCRIQEKRPAQNAKVKLLQNSVNKLN